MKRLLDSCTGNLLISVTLSFLLGTAIASRFGPSPINLPLLFPGLALLALAAILAYTLPKQWQAVMALPFFCLIGFLHTHAASYPKFPPDDIASLIRTKTKLTIMGRIISMVEYDGEQSTFDLAAEAVLVHSAAPSIIPAQPEPVHGTVHVTVQDVVPTSIKPGVYVMALMTVQPIRGVTTPGTFDYRLHMAVQNIRCSGRTSSAAELLPITEPWQSPWQRLRYFPEQARQRTAHFLMEHLDRDTASIYQALLIGTSKQIPPHILEMFKDNGCLHILAISGLHFSLLGLFTAFVLRLLFKQSQWLLLNTHVPTLALVLTAPLLCAYVFIAGMNIPAIRGLITALLTLLALALKRQRSILTLVAATALAMLALQPLALFTSSFQLSFAAVIAIITIFPRLRFFTMQAETTEPIGWRRKTLVFLQSALLVSVAATIGTLPVMLYHFNRVSLIGPVMNLIIEPLLCLWALPLGLIAFPLQYIYPAGAALIFQLGGMGIQTALLAAKTAAAFPYPSLWTITPTFFEISLFFLVCWLLFGPARTRKDRLACLPLSLLLLASFTAPLWESYQARNLQVSFIDVGQGTSTLVQLPDGSNILIDGGGYESPKFNVGQRIVAPFLWHQRIWRLDKVILTHPHKDHYNGVPFLLARFQPKWVIVNGDTGEEEAYIRLLDNAVAAKIPVRVAKTGDVLAHGPNFRLLCLKGNKDSTNATPKTVNDRSLVLHLQFGQQSFLFPADISTRVEPELIQQAEALRSEVMLAAHHGSSTSNGPRLLQAVAPSVIVVSASQSQQGKLPAPEHLATWRQKNISVLSTAEHGTIIFTTEGKILRSKTFGTNARDGEVETMKFQSNNRDLRQAP